MVTVGTDSYVTETELSDYATARGITIAGDKSVLLIKAMDYLESRQFIGTKTVYNQALQFPRILCDDTYLYRNYEYYSMYPQNYFNNSQPCPYDNNTVPNEIKKAQMIAALLIDGGADLQSSLGQAIKREKVSVLETEYQDYTSGAEQHRALDDILRPFLQSGMKVVRS